MKPLPLIPVEHMSCCIMIMYRSQLADQQSLLDCVEWVWLGVAEATIDILRDVSSPLLATPHSQDYGSCHVHLL